MTTAVLEKETQLETNLIRTDGGTQSRAGINRDTVQEYAEAISDGKKLPALIVFYDGVAYWLADGFHRLESYTLIGARDCPVEVRQGTQRDAILFSVNANQDHGLRRTNADKRRAVLRLLEDEEWAQWSDRKIADTCGVSNNFVSELRRDQVSSDDTSSVRTGLDGKQYPATPAARAIMPEETDTPEPDDDDPVERDYAPPPVRASEYLENTMPAPQRPTWTPENAGGSTRVNPTSPEEVATLERALSSLNILLAALGRYSPNDLRLILTSIDARNIDLESMAREALRRLLEIQVTIDAAVGGR